MPDSSVSPVLKWSERHSYALICGIGIFVISEHLWPFLILGLLSFGYFMYSQLDYLRTLHPFPGYANFVTALRIAMVCLCGFFYPMLPSNLLFMLFAIAVGLDVLDGFLARRFGQTSDFGLYFDREGDAFFVAVIASILYSEGVMEGWILIPAYLGYFYSAFLNILPWPAKKEPRHRFASVIAGFFFVALLMPFVLPSDLYIWPLRIAAVLILLSFGLSLYHQLSSLASQR